MNELDRYTEALNQFCRDVSVEVGKAAEAADLARVEQLQDAVREAIANLSLIDFECGRVIHG